MLIVQKFGGTSVGSIERIRHVAQLMIDTQRRGHQVVGVVSAMSGETNRLVDLATQINPQPWSKEYDMLLASGEQVSVALVTLAINSLGGKARGLLAHQLGILTDSVYSKARIQGINTDALRREISQGVIPVVAGFQGVDVENNITTLGRGGSDTSAVAIAAALGADDCEIYTDVDGVYSTDPRLCSKARKLKTITYDEMMELAGLGAKVLQIRSVELAAKYKVSLHVRSSFDLIEGTRVVAEGPKMEQVVVSGIAADLNDAILTVSNLSDQPGLAYEIFSPLAQSTVVVDVIVQARAANAEEGLSLSFTVPKTDLPKAKEILEEKFRSRFPRMQIQSETNAAKVSIVGAGMRHHPGVAAKMFGVLAAAGINIKLISTSEIKVTVLVDASKAQEAVQRLHEAFELDKSQ
ncbi:MAG: aspartate kinase [Bdellovibrionota bacterium]